jgi:hypothetical protein
LLLLIGLPNASENEDKGLTALLALLTRANLAWGVRKDNTDLLKSANSFLSDANWWSPVRKTVQGSFLIDKTELFTNFVTLFSYFLSHIIMIF